MGVGKEERTLIVRVIETVEPGSVDVNVIRIDYSQTPRIVAVGGLARTGDVEVGIVNGIYIIVNVGGAASWDSRLIVPGLCSAFERERNGFFFCSFWM